MAVHVFHETVTREAYLWHPQQPVARVSFTLLGTVAAIQFFVYHGHYNYDHTSEDSVHNELYRSAVPYLRKSHTDCDYADILSNHQSTEPWAAQTRSIDFSPQNIQNGSFTPAACTAAFSVAIIVAVRTGQKQLDVFLPYMHDFLMAQNIHYKIYVIEQSDEKAWNKGILYNIGAKRAIADKFPCLILHDVDLLPLDAGNLYVCTQEPRHLSASIDKFRYVLPYSRLVGGVLAIRADQYVAVDGFSNAVLHTWGEGEAVDLYNRITEYGYTVTRFPRRMSRYTMLVAEPRHRQRTRRLKENRRSNKKSTMANTPYLNVEVTEQKLFTLIKVEL